ncbi:MAG: hypothetical protein ABI700_10050 [Chloroflexota bacterium]
MKHEHPYHRYHPRRQRLYAYILAFVGDNGFPPRHRNIADDLGFTLYRMDRALTRLCGASAGWGVWGAFMAAK